MRVALYSYSLVLYVCVLYLRPVSNKELPTNIFDSPVDNPDLVPIYLVFAAYIIWWFFLLYLINYYTNHLNYQGVPGLILHGGIINVFLIAACPFVSETWVVCAVVIHSALVILTRLVLGHFRGGFESKILWVMYFTITTLWAFWIHTFSNPLQAQLVVALWFYYTYGLFQYELCGEIAYLQCSLFLEPNSPELISLLVEYQMYFDEIATVRVHRFDWRFNSIEHTFEQRIEIYKKLREDPNFLRYIKK